MRWCPRRRMVRRRRRIRPTTSSSGYSRTVRFTLIRASLASAEPRRRSGSATPTAALIRACSVRSVKTRRKSVFTCWVSGGSPSGSSTERNSRRTVTPTFHTAATSLWNPKSPQTERSLADAQDGTVWWRPVPSRGAERRGLSTPACPCIFLQTIARNLRVTGRRITTWGVSTTAGYGRRKARTRRITCLCATTGHA